MWSGGWIGRELLSSKMAVKVPGIKGYVLDIYLNLLCSRDIKRQLKHRISLVNMFHVLHRFKKLMAFHLSLELIGLALNK